MKLTDKAAMFGKSGTWLGGALEDKPSDIIRNHLTVAPLLRGRLREAVDLLGADRVVFGPTTRIPRARLSRDRPSTRNGTA
jgi:hypothetical protein